jgi:hypothetical protein
MGLDRNGYLFDTEDQVTEQNKAGQKQVKHIRKTRINKNEKHLYVFLQIKS